MAEPESDTDFGPAAALWEEYRSSLEDLTFNSKPHINMLTILAEENLPHASLIVTAIEAHSSQAPPTERLPAMYLMDSIIKNVGRDYLHLFTHNIVSTFVGAFEKVDESTRKSLFKLRSTWDDIFPLKKLYALDVRVNTIDPAWPIKPLPPNINTSSIHVNPKFLNKVPEETAGVTIAPSVSATPTNLGDFQEQIRQQLLAKQKQLLELERKKLELDLEQTKAQLAQASLGLNDPLLPPIHFRLFVKPTISSTVLQSPSSAVSKSVETEQSTAQNSASVKDPRITGREPGTNRELRLEPQIGGGEETQHVSVSDRLQVSSCGTAGKVRTDHQFTASNKLSSNSRVKITQTNPLREQDRIHQLINELTVGTGKSKSLSPLKSRPCNKESLVPERNKRTKPSETNIKRDPRLNPQTKVKSHRKVEDTREKKRNDLKVRGEEHDKRNPRSVRNKSSKRTEAKGEQDGKDTEREQGYKPNSSRRSPSPQSPSPVSHSFKSRQRHSPIMRHHSASPSHSTLRGKAGPTQCQHSHQISQKPGKRGAHRTKHDSEPHDGLNIKRQKMAPEERHKEPLDTNYDYVNSPKFSPEPPEEGVVSWSKAPPPKKRKSQSQWEQVKRQQQDAGYVAEGRPALQQRDTCWSRRDTPAAHQPSVQNSLSVDPDLQIPKELTHASKGELLKKANRSFQAGNLSNEQFLQIAHGINQLFQYQETQQKSESGARHRKVRGGQKTSRSASCAAPERSPPDIDLTEAVLSYYEHKSKLVRTKLQPLLSSRVTKDLEGAKANYREDGPGDRSTRHSGKGQTQKVQSASPGYGQGKRQQDKSKSRSPACEVGDPAAKSKRQYKQENEARVDGNSEHVRASQTRCDRSTPKHRENRSLHESGQGHRKGRAPSERRSLSSRERWVSHQEKRSFNSGPSRHSPPVSDQKYAPLLKDSAASERSPLLEEPGTPEQESRDENIFAEKLPYERRQLQPGLDHSPFAEEANYKLAYERVQLSLQKNESRGEQWKEAPSIRPFNMESTFKQDQRLTGHFGGVDRRQLNVHDRGDRRKLQSSAGVRRRILGPVHVESPAGTGRVQCERASVTPWLGAAVYRGAGCVEGSMFPIGQHSDTLYSEGAHRSHIPHARLACRIHHPPEPKFGVLTRPDGSHPHRLEASPGSCFDRPLSPSFDQPVRFMEAPGPRFDSGQSSPFNGSPGPRFGITCGPVLGPGQHCGNEIVQRPEGMRGRYNPKLVVEEVLNNGNAASVPKDSLFTSQPMCNTVPMDIISDHAAPPYNQDTLYFMPVPYRPAAATLSRQPGLQENHLGQLDINELFEKLVATGILSTKKTESISSDTKPHPALHIQPTAPEEEEEEEEEEEIDEELSIPDITDFALDDLKQRYDGVISRLYTGIQCYSCGIRFTATQTDLYADHLDWHYRRNRMKQETVKRSTHRKWYYTLSDWVEFEEVCDLEERTKSQYFETENEEVILKPPGVANHKEFVSVAPECARTEQISHPSCSDNKDGSVSEYTPGPISTAAESPLGAVLATLKHEPPDHGRPDLYDHTSYNIKEEPSGLIASDNVIKKEGIKTKME